MKGTPALSRLPVVMSSVYSDEYVIEELYRLGAAAYVTKHPDPTVEAEQLRVVRRFWSAADLPQHHAPYAGPLRENLTQDQ